MVHLLFGNRADISQFNCQPLNISLIKSLWSNELLWVSKMYHVRNHMWQWVKKQRKRKRSQVISLSGSAGPLLSFFPLAVLDGAARSWKELEGSKSSAADTAWDWLVVGSRRRGICLAINLFPNECVLTENKLQSVALISELPDYFLSILAHKHHLCLLDNADATLYLWI